MEGKMKSKIFKTVAAVGCFVLLNSAFSFAADDWDPDHWTVSDPVFEETTESDS
jgi:hypothetical protein